MKRHVEFWPMPDVQAWSEQTWPWNGPSMEGMFDAYGKWIDSWWRTQNESLRFCGGCVSRSIDVVTSLAESKSPMEALEVQMRYAGDALGDCLDEGRKMLAIATEAAIQGSPGDAARVKRATSLRRGRA